MSALEKIHIAACLVDFPLGQVPVDYWRMIDPEYEYRNVRPGPE